MGVKTYSVLVPAGLSGRMAQDKTLFLADRFSWFAFVLPFVYFLWHRLWLEAGLAFLLEIALGVAAMVLALDEVTATAMIICVNALIAYEAQAIRRFALERRGYHEAAVVQAFSLDEAEAKFFGTQPSLTAAPLYKPPFRPASVIGLFPDPSGPRGA